MGNVSTTPEEAMRVAEESGDVYPPTSYDGQSHVLVKEKASTLSREQLIDRIKGIIYGILDNKLTYSGNCIGDAIGLGRKPVNR